MNGQTSWNKFVGRLIPRRLFKRGHAGQSIIILALGFMALLGFVGIVTDVSLLFVRYSTLRRAVDSASIAAAGQMRRDRNIANVSLSARQFIEFHGLNPTTVVVNTCQSVPQWTDPSDPLTKQPNYDDPEYVRLRALLECENGTEQKLVHVVAEIESPTIFLSMLGWPSVTLQAEAIAETAVIDVAMVIDVSESMLNETTVETWANTVVNGSPLNQGVVYVPPRMSTIVAEKRLDYNAANDPDLTYVDVYEPFWQWMLTHDQYIVNDFMWYDGLDTAPTTATIWPATASGDDLHFWVGRDDNPSFASGPQTDPREECRVRFYPYSRRLTVPTAPIDYVTDYYDTYTPPDDENGSPMRDSWGTGETNYDGFRPTYDFYGCCNDPNGDFLFTDLICQPFKQARDAAVNFIARLDFSRGDRVGFVTFDRQAYQIDPDGEGPAPIMIEDEQVAYQTLTQIIGVRAEPNFYYEDPGDYVDGGAPDSTWDNFSVNGVEVDKYYQIVGSVPTTSLFDDYPVRQNCPYNNALLDYPHSRHIPSTDVAFFGNLMVGNATEGSAMIPDPFGDDRLLPSDAAGSPWSSEASGSMLEIGSGAAALYSYQHWSSCRGTNIGAALREGNNALLDPATVRRDGAVWVMVFLSDGAAGASDPVQVIPSGGSFVMPDPYANPDGDVTTYDAVRGDYGAFGVCPYGTVANPAELVVREAVGGVDLPDFPFCGDEMPESRHFCGNIADAATGLQDLDLSTDWTDSPTSCLYYDVDDYARDWADYIALEDSDASSGELILPTIYTIGFGLDFSNGGGTCAENLEDCLGEELLRYIADVGDNFAIDADYQQDWLDDEEAMGTTGANRHVPNQSLGVEDYGEPGPCEGPGAGLGVIVRLDPTENCGNYFNAPDQDELEEVFNQIASSMFTRISR